MWTIVDIVVLTPYSLPLDRTKEIGESWYSDVDGVCV